MKELHDKIKARLEELRVYLQNDGGDMEVVSIEGKTVTLKLTGACGGCPMATVTLKDGIERALKEEIDPEIVVERAM
jgi:Fe-S cluster biogenesis protein NfuA